MFGNRRSARERAEAQEPNARCYGFVELTLDCCRVRPVAFVPAFNDCSTLIRASMFSALSVPVTVIDCAGNRVAQIKSKDSDGYVAITGRLKDMVTSPGGTTVSLFSRTTISPRAERIPALLAAAKP